MNHATNERSIPFQYANDVLKGNLICIKWVISINVFDWIDTAESDGYFLDLQTRDVRDQFFFQSLIQDH
jgi:hypothetical protein